MGQINDLKDQALASLRGKWGSFVGLTFIYLLLYSIATFFVMYGAIFEGSSFTGLASAFSFIGSILMVLFIPIGYGYIVAYLHASRQDLPADIGDLFYGYSNGQLRRVLGTYILMVLVVMAAAIPYVVFLVIMTMHGQLEEHNGFFMFLSLLLMIPVYVVALAYAMFPFILRDNPELSAREILTKSRMMMQGHKGELFILLLSFIGWGVLAMFTFCIGYLWLAPYICMTYTKYYEQLREEYEGVGEDEMPMQEEVEMPAEDAQEPTEVNE